MNPNSYELNFDGIVGPTHNYSGLSYGNIASMQNQNTISNPKQAALQGLEKMKFMASLGVKQAILPPHERPHIPTLRMVGFEGVDRNIPEKVFKVSPELLYTYSSASSMWAANAAIVSPSVDSSDGKVHFTPANLTSNPHRAIEAATTAKILKAIFPSTAYFVHHHPLPSGKLFADDGSANHSRFCTDYTKQGIQLFVYGAEILKDSGEGQKKFPARQTLEACQALVRLHKLFPDRYVFAKQSVQAIDAGVFHNDVIAVGDRNLFFYHEKAFENTAEVINELRNKLELKTETELKTIEIAEKEIPLSVAVRTYLFNSQLISLADGAFVLVAPIECRTNPTVSAFIDRVSSDSNIPIHHVEFVNIKESMRNGGGPACLRLRVPLNEKELAAVNPNVMFSESLYKKLVAWVNKHYRDKLLPKDLQDPKLVDEVKTALDELTKILNLGSLYSFQ